MRFLFVLVLMELEKGVEKLHKERYYKSVSSCVLLAFRLLSLLQVLGRRRVLTSVLRIVCLETEAY